MIRLPKTIKIAGIAWKVVKDRYGTKLDNIDHRGETDHEKGEIKVHTGAESHVVRRTLLHELLHAVDHAYNPAGPELTERQVLSLETGLFALFNDNPRLLKTIWSDK